MILNCKNVFCEIKFLIFIQDVPFVKFTIFEAQFPKVGSLEIFSRKNIISHEGIINLTNDKGLHAQKTKTFLTRYFYTIRCNNVSKQRLSRYKHKSTLNWLDRISIEKKTWQTATIDKDDSTFSVVYSFLKIKSKTYI